MLKTVEDISSTKKRMLIEIPADKIQAEMKGAFAKAQREARLPGFRPGKVPMSMIVKRYGSAIEAEVLEKLVPEFYKSSVQDSGLTPVSAPILEEKYEYKPNEPILLKIKIDVRPKVEPLNYKGIVIKDVPVTVTDEDVQRMLNAFSNERANYEVSEGEIQEGDLVSFDCSLDNRQEKDLIVRAGASSPYPEEFTKSFIGKKTDDVFQWDADFKDNDKLPLHGMKGLLSIKINSVKKKISPPLDDEFAKDLGYETLEELKDKIRENLLSSRENQARNQKIGQILDKLIETHNFELPESLLENELTTLIQEIKSTQKDNRGEEQLRKEMLPIAEKNVKIGILLELIGIEEGIKVTKDELEQELYATANQLNVPPEELLKYYMEQDGSLLRIHNKAYTRSVFSKLLDYAVIDNADEQVASENSKSSKED